MTATGSNAFVHNGKRVSLLLASLSPLAAAPAFAQDRAAAPASSPPAASAPQEEVNASDQAGIEDIIVTARFRSETAQNTPVSISAFNAATVQNSVITDTSSVQKFLPNVQLSRVAYSGNSLGSSIRGISFSDLEKTYDPAIGVAIDGVFLGTTTGANVDFSDIESIEVLRGPQGTLYGRNTIGGTISVRRTRPTGELGAKLHARYGSYKAFDLDGVFNLPKIGDVASIKLFALRRTSDSFTRSRTTGEHENGRDYLNVGGAVLFEFGADTTLLASADYQKDRSEYPSSVNLTKATGRPFGAGGTICDFTRSIGQGDLGCDTLGVIRQRGENFEIANTSIPFRSYLDGWNSSLELNTRIGGFNLTAVTGYRDTSDQLLEENTGTALVPLGPGVAIPLFVAARDQDYKQFSQEIRVQGDLTDWLDLVAGVYYLHTDYAIRPFIYRGARTAEAYLLNGPAQTFTASQKLDSYAVFAESIVKLGSAVRLTLGGRYTTETKDFALNFTIPTAFNAKDKATFSDPTGRVILDWKANADTLLYASWSRGFRSGGFNGRATTPTAIGPYRPERVDSYEAGIKSDFAGGLFRFNPTVFWAEYKDKQETLVRAAPVGIGTETVIENAASARMRGVEVEIQARPMHGLVLRAAGGYLDAKYKQFLIPDLANPGRFLDVSANRNFVRAPKYSFNGGLDYTTRISAQNSINLTIDVAYLDKFRAASMPDATGAQRDVIPARTTVDASIAFIHEGDVAKNLRVSGYVRDLLNKGGRLSSTLDAGIFYFAGIVVNREFGVEASIKF